MRTGEERARFSVTATVLLVCLGSSLGAMEPARVAELSGYRRGLIALPRPGDTPSVLALTEAGYLVYAVCAEQSRYTEVAKAAQARGTLAQRLYLELNPEPVPGLAERLADVVLVENLTRADLTPVRRAQWMRILAPRRGVLIAGGPDVSAEDLREWLGADARVTEEQGGPLAMVTRPAEPGADQWRHRHHAPDNRRVSADRLLTPQLVTQWYSLPLNECYWGSTVVAAGGRAYTMIGSRNPNEQVDLVARSLHNGCELWRRHYRQKVYGGRSLLAAGDEVLWLGDGADILALDGETGSERRRIAGPLKDGQVRWLALVDGDRLAVLAGPADDYGRSKGQLFVKNPEGTHLAVYTRDGQRVWGDVCAGPVDEREIALTNGRLYYHVRGVGTVARRLSDGSEIWRNTADTEAIDASKRKGMLLLLSDRSLMVDEHAVVIGASWKRNVVALDPGDGHLLWQRTAGGGSRSLAAVLRGGRWYGNAILDARTGKQVVQRGRVPQSVCSATSSVGDWFLTAFGDMYTIEDQEQVRFADVRSPCDIGNIVADGVLLGSAGQCICSIDIQGSRVAGVSDVPLHAAGPAAERLEVFSNASPSPLAVTAEDWPTHRHDPSRSGASPVLAGRQPREKWRLTPRALASRPEGFLNRPMPSGSVTADGLAFMVDSQGVLRAVDVATGNQLWQHILGARSIAPPSIDGGRVFVGDTAGFVHAFTARDGEYLWRFAAAPVARKMLWYGQIFSTWPCTGGVLVHDGTVYAIAGYQETNGIHAYALDAATGKVRWESHDAGSGGQWGPKAGFGCYGHLAAGDGRLWLASGTLYPGSYGLSDGMWVAAPSERDHHFYGITMRRGEDIGVVDDRFVIIGGMRLSRRQTPREAMIKGDGYNALPTDPPKVPQQRKDKSLFGVDVINWSTVTPAWDEELFVGARGSEGRPYAWSCKGVISEIAKEFEKGVDEKARQPQVRSLNVLTTREARNSRQGGAAPANPLWGPVELHAQEQILCADAVVAIHATYSGSPPRPDSPDARARNQASGWFLSALERGDGKERWRVELPSKPMRGGLAIDRHSNVLITFDDGSLRCYQAP